MSTWGDVEYLTCLGKARQSSPKQGRFPHGFPVFFVLEKFVLLEKVCCGETKTSKPFHSIQKTN